jgi:endonuclease-3
MDRDVPFARSHEVLTSMIAPADRYPMHILLIAHGRQTCKARWPRCAPCCLLDLCPHGQSKVAPPPSQ